MSASTESSQSDVLLLLIRRWKRIAIFAVVGAAAAITYSFLAPAWYEAKLTAIPAMPSRESAASLLMNKIPGLDSSSVDSKRIEAVLVSQSVTDAVIEKFDLQKRYGTAYAELTRKELWAHCSTSVDKKSGVVSLKCEDKDPRIARDMTDYFGEVGNRVFQRVSASSAKEEAEFLKTQVEKARNDVDVASSQLRAFQEKHKIIDLPEQSKAVISAMASLQGEILSKQLELSYLRSFSARTESSVVQLQQQIGILEAKLKQLELTEGSGSSSTPQATGSGSGSGRAAEFFPNAMGVPELRFELEQLLREQKIKETVFGLMVQRFEMATVDAARDTSTFSILDHPTLPELRSRPLKRKLAMLGFLGGAAAGILFVLVPFWWDRRVRARLAL